MKPFQYFRPANIKEAVSAVASDPNARFIAGGTNLIDLMKHGIESPGNLVDISHLPLKRIERKNGLLHIGSLALNSDVARHRLVGQAHPLLAQTLNAGASGQLRNMATVGGNMLQQTRCPYFYDIVFPCNRRKPGSGCSALEGINRMHAIFGVDKNKSCIAVHPSDMSVALSALDARVLVQGAGEMRRIPFDDLYRQPGDRSDIANILEKGEVIVAVEIPDGPFTKHIHYLKVRDRASYAFALVSVAAALDMDGDVIKAARLSLGGVAYKPWRLYHAETQLIGKSVSEELFHQTAEAAMEGAVAFEHNAYKLKLAPNAIVEALKIAAGIS